MFDWKKYTLEELADDITVGFVGSMASEYIERGIPFLRSLNVEPLRINQNDIKYISPEFHRRIKKSRLTPGDVVIVRTGKPGACAVVPAWLSDANCSDLVIVRCGSRINNHFLAYYINTVSSGHVASHIVGAVQQHFNVGAARTLPVYLPPLGEQRAIVETLAAFDDKIELNRQMNETLETMARAIFKDWFVDFGPTRAKMAGSKPYLAPEIWKLFPDSLDDEGKPYGWSYDRLGNITELSWGDTNTTKSSYVKSGYPAYSASGPDGFMSHADFDRKGIVLSAIGANCGQTWFASGKWSCIKNTIRIW
jgi:type I restriction enzyme S subunit